MPSSDYEHLPLGLREICELLAEVRDELREANRLNWRPEGYEVNPRG